MIRRLSTFLLCALLAFAPSLSFACTPPLRNAVAQSSFSNATSGSASPLTTTATDTIIILFVADSAFPTFSSTPPALVSITDTASLTWTQRGTRHTYPAMHCPLCSPGGRFVAIDVYWAHSAGILTSDTITVTYASTVAANILVGAFTGVTNFAAPFDANGSLPGTNSDPSGASGPSNVTVSTTRSADAVLAGCWSPIAGGGQCVPDFGPPWLPVVATPGNGSTNEAYLRVLVPQVNLPAHSTEMGQYWAAWADALIGDDTGCSSPSANAIPHVWINE